MLTPFGRGLVSPDCRDSPFPAENGEARPAGAARSSRAAPSADTVMHPHGYAAARAALGLASTLRPVHLPAVGSKRQPESPRRKIDHTPIVYSRLTTAAVLALAIAWLAAAD